jgi:hypothetical protein
MKNVATRIFLALASGLIALPIVQVSGTSFFHGLLVYVVLSFLGYLLQSVINVLIAVLMSVATTTLLVRLYAVFDPSYSINSSLILLTFAVALAVNVFLLGLQESLRFDRLEVVAVASLSMVLYLANSNFLVDSKQSLVKIFSAGGEDSAAWLYQMSSGFRDGGGYFLSPLSSLSSGIFGGVYMTLLKTFFNSTNTEFLGFYGTPQTLQSSYFLIAFVNGLLALKIFRLMFKGKQESLALTGMLLSALLSYFFSFAFVLTGHLSALLVVMLVMAIFVALESQKDSHVFAIRSILVGQLVYVLVETWYVFGLVSLTFVALIFVTVVLKFQSSVDLRNIRFSGSIALKLFAFVAAMSLFFITTKSLVLSSFDFDYVKRLFALGGGTYAVVPLLGIVVFGLVFKNLFESSKFDSSDLQTNSSLRTFLLSVVVVTFGIFLFSHVIPPHLPQYGPQKFMSIVFVALIPIAAVEFFKIFSKFSLRPTGTLLVAAMFLLPFFFSGHPLNFVETVVKENEIVTTGWQSTLMNEVKRDPGRTVVCLDTGTGDWEYTSYVCTRTARGIQGMNDNPSGLWQHGSLCAPSAIFDFDFVDWGWTEEFFSNLTVIVSNPKSLTNGVGCQVAGWKNEQNVDPSYTHGWLTFVQWDLVRVISMETGELVDTTNLAW